MASTKQQVQARMLAALWLLLAACLAACVRADSTIREWNRIVMDAMMHHQRFGADTGLAPLPPVANVLGAGRIVSILHVAQWKAAQAVLAAHDITTMDEAKAHLPELLPELQTAIASAGAAVIAVEVPEKNYRAEGLLAETGNSTEAEVAAAAMGKAAAEECVALRAKDGADAHPGRRGFQGSNDTGKWRPTPPEFAPGAGVQWAKVTPWVMDSPEELRPPAPPALKSEQYKKSYLTTIAVGNETSATRTAAHTEEAYLWNEFPDALLFDLVDQMTKDSDLLDATRLYAMASVAGVDARVCAFDAKYHYSNWRPVTAIPLGNGVGFAADPTFTPVVATPPTPEYPSATALYGAAVLDILRRAGGGGDATIDVKLASPVPLPVAAPPAPRAQGPAAAPVPEGAQELEGPGQRRRRGLQGEQGGAATAYVTRTYRTLTEVGDQLALSRVRAGVNFRFTADASVTAGRAVADKVWKGFDAKFTSIKMGAEGAATAPERKKAEHTRRRRALRAAM